MGRGQLSEFDTLNIKTFDSDVLAAGLTLNKPGIVFCAGCPKDHTYLYDVTFKVNLAVGKEKSKKPVGKAYASYYKAKLAGDIDEVKKWVVKEHVKDFDSEMGKAMIKMSMSMDPKEVKIVKTDISGDSAKLIVKGKTNDQSFATGSVEMVIENGQWKVNIDKWDLTK